MPDAAQTPSRLRLMIEFFKRMLGRRPAQPGDPYAYVMAPVHRGPERPKRRGSS